MMNSLPMGLNTPSMLWQLLVSCEARRSSSLTRASSSGCPGFTRSSILR